MSTALATLSLCVAVALVAFVSYHAGEFIRSYGRDARISNVYELALKEPPKGLEAVVSILREHDEHLLANSVNAICLTFWDQLADEMDRSSRLHRRAQKAEGLLARRAARDAKRAAKIEEALDLVDDEPKEAFGMVHDMLQKNGEQDLALVFASPWLVSRIAFEREHGTRARKLHRRAQKAEGALRRLKWKVLKNGPAGILSAEDHAAFAADVAAFLEKDKGYPYQRAALQDSLKTRTQVSVTESGDLVSIGVHFDPSVVRDSIPKAPMPPIPVTSYWTGPALDIGRAKK